MPVKDIIDVAEQKRLNDARIAGRESVLQWRRSPMGGGPIHVNVDEHGSYRATLPASLLVRVRTTPITPFLDSMEQAKPLARVN